MLRQQRVWSAQRILVVGVVIVAVIATAIAVTIILYQVAIADAGQARAATLNSQRAQQLIAVTAEQRICMFEYLTTGSSAALATAQALDTQFDQVFGAVASGSSAAETQALTDASGHPVPLLHGLPGRPAFRGREPVAAGSRRSNSWTRPRTASPGR